MKSFIRISVLLVFFCLAFEGFAQEIKALSLNTYPKNYLLTAEDNVFLDTLQFYTLQYFLHEMDPQTGLVKDRSSDTSPASIAAMGFAIPAWAIGVERGWMDRDLAARYTLNMLDFLLGSRQSADPVSTGYKGLYYHFLDMKTGLRVWQCELSTIDTAWLLAGLRFAAFYFNTDCPVEAEIREKVDKVTRRVDWDWIAMADTSEYPHAISMSWHPERGFSKHAWRGFNEALYIYPLAAGSGMNNARAAYDTWLKYYRWEEPYEGMAHAIFPPLFGHQYSHMFIDFRAMVDTYMENRGIDYFENARRATLTQRLYGIDNPMKWQGYDSLTWGWTACDGPGSSENTGNYQFRSYWARGNSGPQFIDLDDGTIAPTAAGGSLPFAPKEIIATLRHMKEKYGDKGLWGKYGFLDSFNPTINWYNSDYLGIDQGPIIIMAENLRSGLIWKYAMQDTLLQKGMQKVGLRHVESYPFENAIRKFKEQDKQAMPPADAVLFIGSSSIRMWKTLHEDMAPLKVINRGFGGSQTEHAIHYFDQIVSAYNPRAVVLYEGDNDIAAGKTPQQVFSDFKTFAGMVRQKLPGVPLFFISIKPSISREKVLPQMQQANTLIRDYCKTDNNLVFIDVASAMMDKDRIKADIFIQDNLHMNDKGYDIWEDQVKTELAQHLFLKAKRTK